MSLFLIPLAASASPSPATGSLNAWIGGAVCLVLWIGYGWMMRSSGEKLRQKLMRMPRNTRVFLGSGGLLIGLILLMGGMVLLALMGGADEGGIKLWAWPLVFLLGLAFVHLQVLGAAALMTLAGRPSPDRPSSKGSEETRQVSSASEPTEPRS